MNLKKYRSKRSFEKTSEPEGRKRKRKNNGNLRFVVQKHAASHLHFDFRLESEGVLKSWAVPRGIPGPREKRLAMMVEDHPLEYQNFEGVITEGNYGAGTVMIWDKGTYELKNEFSLAAKIKKGEFSFQLFGKKIKGGFSMVKIKNSEKNTWLLIGKNNISQSMIDMELSAVSGKSMEEISLGRIDLHVYPEAIKSSMPEFINPMLATFIEKPFRKKNWLFEIKWDGYRIVARKENKDVALYSRNKQQFKDKFFTIAQSLKKIPGDFVLDGEVVALDTDGKSNFQMLQKYLTEKKGILIYYVFDIMHIGGYDVTNLELKERRNILDKLIVGLENVRISEFVEKDGIRLFEKILEHGGEGIIAKRSDSFYLPNFRGPDWLKIKSTLAQETVICGFTKPQGGRKKFGSLILGLYENKKLKFIGHVGGGFDEKLLSEVYEKLMPLVTDSCPFEKIPKTNTEPIWVSPQLVCEVKFFEWTDEGILRHPIFLGLRSDKDAKSVKRELPKKINEISNTFSKKKFILTNLEKIYWPDNGYTKGDLIEYYRKISKYILPYLINRPQSLNRFPNGIYEKSFFQKNMSEVPDWIKKVKIFSESEEREIEYMICRDEDSLIYMANLGCIEINPWNSSLRNLENPDYMVFDIDPQDLPFSAAVKVAQETKKILDKISIEGYCKTSGKRGLHIYVPVAAQYSYDQVKEFAKIVNMLVHRATPEISSIERKPNMRNKKVYLDYLQNRKGQTMAAAYCIRPLAGAPVSTPIDWSELNLRLDPMKFNMCTIFGRLEKKGDVWKNMLKAGADVDLAKSLILLERLVHKKVKQKEPAHVVNNNKNKCIRLRKNNMAKYGKKAQEKVKEVMHEFKQGRLKSGQSNKPVKNPKQAVAIGLSEARKKGAKVPPPKKSNKLIT